MAGAMEKPQWAWINGRFIPWDECTLHVRTQAVMFGGSVFEGVRAYWNADKEELYVFKLREHIDRLRASMKIMRMKTEIPGDFEAACVALLSRNEFREDVHLIPTAYLGFGEGYLSLSKTREEGLFVTAVARPTAKWLTEGKRVRISSWTRISDNSMPPRVKAAGNYQNSRLALLEAWQDGYDDAILLNAQGTVAEAAGACLMMVRRGQVSTPPVTAGILESITRSTLIELFKEKLGTTVVERDIDRTELYLAEEVFLCGSGMEVAPVVGIDRLAIGDGKIGPITASIQRAYFRIARAEEGGHADWRTPVYGRAKVSA